MDERNAIFWTNKTPSTEAVSSISVNCCRHQTRPAHGRCWRPLCRHFLEAAQGRSMPLTVCGDVGGRAAVAVRGLRPFNVQVQKFHLRKEKKRKELINPTPEETSDCERRPPDSLQDHPAGTLSRIAGRLPRLWTGRLLPDLYLPHPWTGRLLPVQYLPRP